MVTTALTGRLLEMQVNESSIKGEIGELNKRVTNLSDSLKNVAFWILGIFTLYIPQIIFAFQQAKAKANLKKLNEKVKEVSVNIARIKNELNVAQGAVKALENQRKADAVQPLPTPPRPSLGFKETVIITPKSQLQELKKVNAADAKEEVAAAEVEEAAAAKAAADAKVTKAVNTIQKSYSVYKKSKIAKANAAAQAAEGAKVTKAVNTIQKSYSVYKKSKIAKANAAAAQAAADGKATEAVNTIQKSYSVYKKSKIAKANAAAQVAAAAVEAQEAEGAVTLQAEERKEAKERFKANLEANMVKKRIEFQTQYEAVQRQQEALALTVQRFTRGFRARKEIKANKPGKFRNLVNDLRERAEKAKGAAASAASAIRETGKEVGDFLRERPEVGLTLAAFALQIGSAVQAAMNPSDEQGK